MNNSFYIVDFPDFEKLENEIIPFDFPYEFKRIFDRLIDGLSIKIKDIIIIYVPIKALKSYHFYNKLLKFREEERMDDKDRIRPIIFFTQKNIFNNYHDFGFKEQKEIFKAQKEDYNERLENQKFDKRKYFLDSSIWHYYLPYETWNNKSFEDNFTHILKTIEKNYLFHLYKTQVAKQYLEFQTRLMAQSYLSRMDLPVNLTKDIVPIAPFVFHSETEMRLKANKKITKLIDNGKEFRIKWNVLLVDKYASKFVEEIRITKKNIIENVLQPPPEDIDEKYHISKKSIFSFNYTTTRDKNILDQVRFYVNRDSFIKKLKEKFDVNRYEDFLKIKNNEKRLKANYPYLFNENNEFILNKKLPSIQFDIILLDYILGENTLNNIEGNATKNIELGSDLFAPTYKDLSKHKGPLGKHWMLLTTAFSKAMNDKIRSLGVDHIHNDWYLFDGADPIVTPQLFRYKLYKLIELQLEQATVSKKRIVDFLIFHTSKQDVNFEGSDNIRILAKQLYGLYMHRFGLREALKYDEKRGSAFALTIGDYIDKYLFEDLEFYENIRKLLYLIGYGTHADVKQIWFIFSKIVAIINKMNFDKSDKSKIKQFFDSINDYLNLLNS